MNPSVQEKQIALVFDFDGTVAPDVMLAPIFDMIEIESGMFWEKTRLLTEEGYDREIAYLQALIFISRERGIDLSNAQIRDLGAKLEFYNGFPEVLGRLKQIGSDYGYQLAVYVITAGLEEMVMGSRLAPYLSRCWGCGFAEDLHGSISHPMRTVTSANKVEKLYLIKRQLLDHKDTYRVNLVEPLNDLVPWSNLIYVADGATDVPAFEVVRRGGGFALAVYDPENGPSESMMIAGRTDLMVPADYREGSLLDTALTDALKAIKGRMEQAI